MKSNQDRYMQYRTGWIDGAKASAMNPALSNHADNEFAQDYITGYGEGYKDRMEMGRKAAKRFGYDPSPLRLLESVAHGIDCPKAKHGPEGGYLHGEDDDTPYDVDGCTYCGRCHVAI